MKQTKTNLTTPFDIPILMYLPDDEVTKIVIAVHGFSGSKASRVTKAVAERLTAQHTAVIAFDFPAHGESKEDERMLTVENCQNALSQVADFAEREFPHVYDFGIFATSFGGYITLSCVDRLKEQLGDFSMVLRAPAVKMHFSLLRILNITEDDLIRAGAAKTNFGERPITVTYDFFRDIKAHDVYYDNDMSFMIIHGDRDTIVTRDDIFGYLSINGDAVYAPVKNATHTFDHPGDVEKIVGYADMWFTYRAQNFD